MRQTISVRFPRHALQGTAQTSRDTQIAHQNDSRQCSLSTAWPLHLAFLQARRLASAGITSDLSHLGRPAKPLMALSLPHSHKSRRTLATDLLNQSDAAP